MEMKHPGIFGVAVIQCGRCPATFRMNLRSLTGPDIIDKKAKSKGWRLDPHVCPICQKRNREDRGMSTTAPTPAALAAQGRMHRLLDDHFDVAKGCFAADWNDARVAKETGIAESMVGEYRKAAFGELRMPTEIEALQRDLAALSSLALESRAEFDQQLAQLRARVAEVARKFAA